MNHPAARLLLLAILALSAWLPTRAHPGHDSVAEVFLNRETNKLEVTLSVHVADLELALSKASGQPVAFEKEPPAKLDKSIHTYLAATFLVNDDATGARLPLEWIGKELAREDNQPLHHLALLHFEIPVPPAAAQLQFKQTTFCELFDDQINLVYLRDGDHKQMLGFSPAHDAKTISLAQQNQSTPPLRGGF